MIENRWYVSMPCHAIVNLCFTVCHPGNLWCGNPAAPRACMADYTYPGITLEQERAASFSKRSLLLLWINPSRRGKLLPVQRLPWVPDRRQSQRPTQPDTAPLVSLVQGLAVLHTHAPLQFASNEPPRFGPPESPAHLHIKSLTKEHPYKRETKSKNVFSWIKNHFF